MIEILFMYFHCFRLVWVFFKCILMYPNNSLQADFRLKKTANKLFSSIENRQGMYKNRVENDRKNFEIPAFLF